MRLRLDVLVSPQQTFPFAHAGPTVVIGRDASCELSLNGDSSAGVSWQHARITLAAEQAYVQDLDSSNGTFVNDRRVEGRRPLRVGDYLRLGQVGPTLRVVALDLLEGPAQPVPPPTDAPQFGILVPDRPPRLKVQAAQSVAPVPAPAAAAAPPRPAAEPARGSRPSAPSHSTLQRAVLAMHNNQRHALIMAGAFAAGVAILLVGFFLLFEGRLGELTDQNRDTAETTSELKGQVSGLDNKNANLEKKVTQEGERTSDLKDQVSGLKDKTADLNKQLSHVDEKTAQLKGHVSGLKDKTSQLEGHVSDLKAKPKLPPSGAEVYRQTLRSTALVGLNQGGGFRPSGTGALVDADRKLLLTAYHVVAVGGRPEVYFPLFDDTGKVIAEQSSYLHRAPIRGRVLVSDSRRDLAVVELERIPAGVPVLSLAEKSCEPGDTVHTIGNPGVSNALWVYTEGRVRQVYRKQVRAFLPPRGILEIDAWMLETQSPINRGDSGGPVVNTRSELVAVNSSSDLKGQLMSYCIDLREIRAVLSRVHP